MTASRPRRPSQLRARGDVLPAQQEAHEVLGGDRLDLATAPLLGVRVDAGQQPPGAALARSAMAGSNGAPQREAARARGGPAPTVHRGCARGPWRRSRSAAVTGPRSRGGRAGPGPPPLRGRGTRSAPRRRIAASVDGARSPPRGRRTRRRRRHRAARRSASSSNSACPLGLRPATRRARPAGRRARRRCARSAALSASHPLDGVGVERPEVALVDGQAAPQRAPRWCAGPAARRVVEERVGPGGEDLVGEQRRLGGVDEVDADASRPRCAPSSAREPVDVERLVSGMSCMVWRTSGWSGISIGPGDVLLAGGRLREHRGHEVVGLHALDRRRVACGRPGTAAPPGTG